MVQAWRRSHKASPGIEILATHGGPWRDRGFAPPEGSQSVARDFNPWRGRRGLNIYETTSRGAHRENISFRMTPVAYETEGSTGHIAGYFTRGEGDAARHFGHFLISMKKGADQGASRPDRVKE